jgi:hypothetical protein
MKQLFRITHTRGADIYVIADGTTEAEEIIKSHFIKWEYFEPEITHIERLASVTQYGKPAILLFKEK